MNINLRNAFSVVVFLALAAMGCGSSGGGGGTDNGGTSFEDTGTIPTDVVVAVPDLPAFNPPEKNAVVGRVVSPSGRGIEGATVTVADAAPATTNYDGFYFVADVGDAQGRTVRFAAPGFVPATRVATTFQDGRSTVNAVLSPRAAALPLDAGASGKAVFGQGTVVIPTDGVVDSSGKAPAGPVSLRVTPIPIRGPGVAAVPGDFAATTAGGQDARLETFAMADYQLADADGNVLAVKDGAKATIEMLLPADTTLKAGDSVPAWHFDQDKGRWIEEGTGTVVAYSQDASRLAFVADVGHFSTWNCDKTMETTCVSGTIRTCDGKPAPGADLMAQGVDYDGTSDAWAGTDGTFCIPVKIGGTVTVAAAHGYPPNRLVATASATAGSSASSCPGPCTTLDVTLPCTAAESPVDCSDTYFAGCKSCIKGRVVDKNGVPQAAVLQASTGLATYTIVTDDKGAYCAPAALGKLVSVSASTATGRSGSTSLVPAKTGACPDCETAPDLVLSDSTSGSDDDSLDFSKCPAAVGGAKLTKVVANGADPALARIDAAYGTLSLTPAKDDDPATWLLDLYFVASGDAAIGGNPIATLTIRGEGLPASGATYDVSAGLSGSAWSAIGSLVGLGGETYRLNEETGRGAIVLDSGFAKLGDAVKGTFDVELGADCGPRGATLALRGTIDVKVQERASLFPDYTDAASIERYTCGLIGLFLFSLSIQTSEGMVQVALDGVADGGEPSPLNGAAYRWQDDRFALNYYGDNTTVMLQVDHPVAGSNVVTGGSLYLDGSDCYYEVGSGTVTLQSFNGADVDRWLTGSFAATFTKSSFSSGTDCPDHVVDGQFGAAVCR